ncbi:hypothetical protein CASFOL_027669 [Castilleja foliolosa]|uniref:Uncharacterized protein n=1 Tax=Castilleja foliolosa TaxID=1961234 RepID=A0ABD3CG99_9LAMI
MNVKAIILVFMVLYAFSCLPPPTTAVAVTSPSRSLNEDGFQMGEMMDRVQLMMMQVLMGNMTIPVTEEAVTKNSN